MPEPVALDTYCKAGGATRGYQRAGFRVVGVDIEPQPNYCGDEFIQADALDVLADRKFLARFDLIHASPPCQDHSPLSARAGKHGTGWMLQATLDALARQPALWVVENVRTAHNRADIMLCGEMFGLYTVRHRNFTIDPRYSGLLMIPPHPRHRRRTRARDRINALAEGYNLSVTGDIGVHAGVPCLGIDWMNGDELSQAIPPAYTEYIGRQLMETVFPGMEVVSKGKGIVYADS
jgi:DNA (cytosine-5)-methyltransferase 1